MRYKPSHGRFFFRISTFQLAFEAILRAIAKDGKRIGNLPAVASPIQINGDEAKFESVDVWVWRSCRVFYSQNAGRQARPHQYSGDVITIAVLRRI